MGFPEAMRISVGRRKKTISACRYGAGAGGQRRGRAEARPYTDEEGRTRGAMRVTLPDGAELSRHPGADVILELLKQFKTNCGGRVCLQIRCGRGFGVTEYMQGEGYRIIPVNPNEREVLGEKSYAQLEDVPEKIDIVNIFRRAEDVAPVVETCDSKLGRKWFGCSRGLRTEKRGKGAGGGVWCDRRWVHFGGTPEKDRDRIEVIVECELNRNAAPARE